MLTPPKINRPSFDRSIVETDPLPLPIIVGQPAPVIMTNPTAKHKIAAGVAGRDYIAELALVAVIIELDLLCAALDRLKRKPDFIKSCCSAHIL